MTLLAEVKTLHRTALRVNTDPADPYDHSDPAHPSTHHPIIEMTVT